MIDDWAEELIGASGLLPQVSPLTWLARPEELEQAADTLAGLIERGAGSDDLADTVEWLRALAMLARTCMETIKRDGLRWDPDRRAVVGPRGGGRGAPRTSHVLAVVAAWERLGGRTLDAWYSADTLAAIRERLTGLVPAAELTDEKIKRRIQRYTGS